MSLIKFSVKRPVTVLMVTLIIILLGAVSYYRIPIDLLPDITYPALTIRTTYSDVGAEEIENTITRPIEEALAAIADVESISSVSSLGSSRVTVNFKWGQNLESAAADIRERLDRVAGRLPSEASSPVLFKFDLSAAPVMFLGVESRMDINELQEYIENNINHRIERIPGVASIDVRGGRSKEIRVDIDPKKLESYNIAPSRVTGALRSSNINSPAGSVKEGLYEITVRMSGEFETVDDVRNCVVAVINGQPVLVKDIASVNLQTQKIRSVTWVNDAPGVRLTVSKQSGANTVEVAEAVGKEIERINSQSPYINIFSIIDTSDHIKKSINSVKTAAMYGAILAAIVLFVFLRNFRSTLIIGVAIPVSIIATFILIYTGGITLNIISFGGLALGIGMLLDNSIVVLENTFRHIQDENLDKKTGAVVGASEVSGAIIASTLTTIAVFIPMVFITGATSVLFNQIAFVVAFSLLCSLFVSFTITPMLCSRYLKVKRDRPPGWMRTILDAAEKGFKKTEYYYGKIISVSLNNKKIVVFAALLILAVTFFLARDIETELMPASDEGEIRVSAETVIGGRLEVILERMETIRDIIKERTPEIESTTANIGGGGFGFAGGNNSGTYRIKLVDRKLRERSTDEIASDLTRVLSNVAGVRVRVRSSSGMWIMRRLAGDGERITVEIRGNSLETGFNLANSLSARIQEISGVTDARVSRTAGLPERRIKINYDKAAKLGLSVSDINEYISIGFGGRTASYFREEGREYPIYVQFKGAEELPLEEILNFQIPLQGGLKTRLWNVLDVYSGEGPVSIERLDQERILYVSVNYEDRSLSAVAADIQDVINRMPIPSDFNVVVGGEYEEQQKSFKEMLFVFVLALLLVYMIMASQFESFGDPFIVLFSVPLASTGVIVTLLLTGTLFNIQGFIGIIMLAGIVVNNAIILVDYINLLYRTQNMKLYDAVELAAKRRLRPILMTTLTTVLGLLPLALGLGEGAELQAPLARTVSGGLLSSMLITLVLIPVLYVSFEELRKKLKL